LFSGNDTIIINDNLNYTLEVENSISNAIFNISKNVNQISLILY